MWLRGHSELLVSSLEMSPSVTCNNVSAVRRLDLKSVAESLDLWIKVTVGHEAEWPPERLPLLLMLLANCHC